MAHVECLTSQRWEGRARPADITHAFNCFPKQLMGTLSDGFDPNSVLPPSFNRIKSMAEQHCEKRNDARAPEAAHISVSFFFFFFNVDAAILLLFQMVILLKCNHPGKIGNLQHEIEDVY